MILAMDVLYEDVSATAHVAGIVFESWKSAEIVNQYTKLVEGVAPYDPGAFYKRELPCLLQLLEDVQEDIETIIVDGYVDLNRKKPGLGRYLFHELRGDSEVVGVAKTFFDGNTAEQILRGKSKQPLYVTAAGMDNYVAAKLVKRMHGDHRIPTMLKKVDTLSRNWLA